MVDSPVPISQKEEGLDDDNEEGGWRSFAEIAEDLNTPLILWIILLTGLDFALAIVDFSLIRIIYLIIYFAIAFLVSIKWTDEIARKSGGSINWAVFFGFTISLLGVLIYWIVRRIRVGKIK